MVDLDFQEKFRHIIKKIEETGIAYSEAKGQSYQMQELKGSVLASLMQNYGDLPVSQREIQSKASEDYKKHIQETSEAIKKELRLKAEYEKWRCSFEALRSLSSLEKSTRNLVD